MVYNIQIQSHSLGLYPLSNRYFIYFYILLFRRFKFMVYFRRYCLSLVIVFNYSVVLTLILRRSRTGTVWFYTSTSNRRAARPKLYTKSLTRDLKPMYSRFTLVRISINLQAPRFFYIGTGVSLLFRERFLYI